MAQKSKNLICPLLFVLCSLFLWSCGIEDVPFINPIPQGNITQQLNNRAIVRVPADFDDYFSYFAVFYRIYVSDIPQASTTTNTYSAINTTLASDYNNIHNYIDSTTQINVNMDRIFQNRGYKYLCFENDNISSILSRSVLGQSLVFDFSSSRRPTISVGSSTYVLWRSTDGDLFSPRPDRYFINSVELSSPGNINNQINADVVNKAGIPDEGMRYTYAAMFIVAVGTTGISDFYSTPSLIHVFLLPD
jgi:hypothetical protein